MAGIYCLISPHAHCVEVEAADRLHTRCRLHFEHDIASRTRHTLQRHDSACRSGAAWTAGGEGAGAAWDPMRIGPRVAKRARSTRDAAGTDDGQSSGSMRCDALFGLPRSMLWQWVLQSCHCVLYCSALVLACFL